MSLNFKPIEPNKEKMLFVVAPATYGTYKVAQKIAESPKGQATKNASEKNKVLAQEMREARKYKRESKILNTYGENQETGKRSWGKILGKTILNSILFGPAVGIINTLYKMNKADNIQNKRDIAELKGEVEEYRDTKEIRKEQFVNNYARDPKTGVRPFVPYAALTGMPAYTINCAIADKIAEKIAAQATEASQEKTEVQEAVQE